MKTAVALSVCLSGASAFVPSTGFMGSAVTSKAAVSDSKIQMVFGLGVGAKKGGKASGVKAGAKAVRPVPVGPDYLRTPEPGSGPLGQWYIRDDPSLSKALPWVTKPQIGDGSLVGDFGFDPWGLSKIFDVNFLRSAELKHGRIAMLATLGLVTPELVQKPDGFTGFQFAPEFTVMNGIAALGSVPKFGIAQIVLVLSLIEIFTFNKVYNEKYNYEDNLTPLERQKVITGRFNDLSGAAKTQGKAGVNPFGNAVDVDFKDPDQKLTPGDLGFDPLGFSDSGVNPDYALAEIKHARLAMIAVTGMLIQASLTKDTGVGILQQTAEWAAGKF